MRIAVPTRGQLLLLLSCVLAIGASFFISPRDTFSQSGGSPMTGYAWSDTIGWVSFNCSDLGTCATSTYGMTIAVDGTITGYAWSEHAGWLSANSSDLTGCPTAPCTARMNGNSMQGWLKVLSSNNAQSGSWDGFISLSGSNYGPTLASGSFSGYAWGDTNVGWLSFSSSYGSAQTTWVPCTPSFACNADGTTRDDLCTVPVESIACPSNNICPTGTGICTLPVAPSTTNNNKLSIDPKLIRKGQSVNISWAVDDATTCSVTDGNTTISGSSSASATCTHAGNACVSNAIQTQTTFTLTCTGPGGELTPAQTATVYLNPAWKEI